MAEGAGNIGEYIKHHLQNNTQVLDESHSFWTINADSVFYTILTAVVFLAFFGFVARNAKAGVPSKTQSIVEMIIKFIDEQVKDIFHYKSKVVAPLVDDVDCQEEAAGTLLPPSDPSGSNTSSSPATLSNKKGTKATSFSLANSGKIT